ncbi:hypothetical protein H6P81_007989 [Aristolochia fimbriata]|uniref:Uncharacterized protein n=1 Tax=Aristolochia fimbriata TaxID=158543 RepID=A0AAV7F1R5_ARIFI|nr:hypothetical protein H6P81_007989 [Aristolochia fimbriata]
MMGSRENRNFFSLTSLQIGDLQSYLSRLSLFLAPESNKLYILVDNRPWLIDKESRSAHLWQLMVTKSRLSPFAHTKARRNRKDLGKGFELKNASKSHSKAKNVKTWFSVIDAAMYRKKALLPVKKLRDSLLLNSELHRTLYGFIVFEVAWENVRGMNYLNELQTDTSLALESKFMKRWEFDSIEHALSCISSWFPGTYYDQFLLREFLEGISSPGEKFYDTQDDFSVLNGSGDFRNVNCGENSTEDKCHIMNLLETPSTPPPFGPYKRRKITESTTLSSAGEADAVSEEPLGEFVSSPKHPVTSDATEYRDVLILFRFNDRDLPFRLKEIIMSDLRLLTLLESGLPSWVIFLQSYPVFCHLYRPWMCPLVRALYVLISLTTVLIGFYDLYKNVPVLKATASRLCGPLFIWIENWEMISRIKYLGTMLFLHNFEKAVKWSLVMTRYTRSLFSILTKPLAGPLIEFGEFLLPFWHFCLEMGESVCSLIWIVSSSICGTIVTIIQVFLWPIWFIISAVWRIGIFLLWPIIWAFCEILMLPMRLVLSLASFLSFLCYLIFDSLGKLWFSVGGMFQLASDSQNAVSTYEASMWSSLWNDLFSQIFRATRSIINGFVAFFVACNRHRLSIYNHMREFFLQLSCFASCNADCRHGRRNRETQHLLERRKSQRNKASHQTRERNNKRGSRTYREGDKMD